ncbi:MAG: hypothetical protein L6V78_03750 [Clostridium sp.]|nr:MAG: hypothetical protein L6V78_03750 [Clostridium sp.]
MKYDNKIVLIDYKTGETDIDLRLAPYGLKTPASNIYLSNSKTYIIIVKLSVSIYKIS